MLFAVLILGISKGKSRYYMARISGVDLPKNKRVEISLTYIYGIGRCCSIEILKKAKLDPNIKLKDLSENQVSALRAIIGEKYIVEGELRSQIAVSIKRLMDIKSYRGLRHRRGLPVRGQRTKTNSRTRKGRRAGLNANRR